MSKKNRNPWLTRRDNRTLLEQYHFAINLARYLGMTTAKMLHILTPYDLQLWKQKHDANPLWEE